MSTIEALLAEVAQAGAALSIERGKLATRGETLPSDLVARLLAAKPEVIEALRRQRQRQRQQPQHEDAPKPPEPAAAPSRCRYCGEPIAWRRPSALGFADGTAAHLACYEQAEVERLLAASERAVGGAIGTSDEGEILMREETLP